MNSAIADLAGYCHPQPHYFNNRARINHLMDRYLSIHILNEHFADLPHQFAQPQPRPWQPIHWNAIHPQQIIGIRPELFLLVIAGAAEIEAPIRSYSHESWCYLQSFHAPMAQFMGGEMDEHQQLVTPGVWEKEERQHRPAFSKIYQQLTGEKLVMRPNSVDEYCPSTDPWTDMQNHVMARIATEWSAASTYLWLLAHATGELQRAIAQPLQDEVNHLAKFWGFSRWAFGTAFSHQVFQCFRSLQILLRHHSQERTVHEGLHREVDRFADLPLLIELGFTFARVIVKLHTWDQELCLPYLTGTLGDRPRRP